MKAYVTAACPFEAAREVGILPRRHRSRRLHGHSFLAKVRAQLDGEDWADFPGNEPAFIKERLRHCVAALDYQYLNDILSVPTDESIARYIIARVVDIPGVDMAGVQSTPDAGVDLDERNRAHIWRSFQFEAAHQLPNVPSGHKCGRMHGHSFQVILHVNQNVASNEMGMDFDQLDRKWQPLHKRLHNSCLNDLAGLGNPTSELLADWIWKKLKPRLPDLSWVTVYETTTAGCHYDGNKYRIWKELRFESAIKLSRAPKGDRRRRLHGHSYVTRLHVQADLDSVLGWTLDYGDIKEAFSSVYKQLDHHALNELEDLKACDTVSLLYWIYEKVGGEIPHLDRIDLYETPGCGAFLQWRNNGPALPA